MGLPTFIPASSLAPEAIVLIVLCIIVVALRFVSRYAAKMPLLWDDWLILPALAVTLGMAAVILRTVQMGGFNLPTVGPGVMLPPSFLSPAESGSSRGLGPPAGAGPAAGAGPPPAILAMMEEAKQQAAVMTRLQAIFQCLQILSLAFLKCSVLLFYRRLFCTGHRGIFDRVTKILLAMTIAWAIAFFIAGIVSCPQRLVAGATPALTDPAVYMCAGSGAQLAGPYGFILSDVITDFVVLLTPLPMVWKLQINLKRKVALSGVFLLGGLACASSVIRLVGFLNGIAFEQAASQGGPAQAGAVAKGVVGFASLMSFYSMLETGLALIAACLPTLRFLFTKKGWVSLRGRSKRLSGLLDSLGSSALRSRTGGRKSEKMSPTSSASQWSYSQQSTVVRSPSPVAVGGSTEKFHRDSVWVVPVEDVDVGRLEEGRAQEEHAYEQARDEPERQADTVSRRESEYETEWLKRTVAVTRAEQV